MCGIVGGNLFDNEEQVPLFKTGLMEFFV